MADPAAVSVLAREVCSIYSSRRPKTGGAFLVADRNGLGRLNWGLVTAVNKRVKVVEIALGSLVRRANLVRGPKATVAPVGTQLLRVVVASGSKTTQKAAVPARALLRSSGRRRCSKDSRSDWSWCCFSNDLRARHPIGSRVVFGIHPNCPHHQASGSLSARLGNFEPSCIAAPVDLAAVR
ncbi:hypothetical protein L209DRAFT_600373 [Thermothelomyces heterothallicus CBS 203.75]